MDLSSGKNLSNYHNFFKEEVDKTLDLLIEEYNDKGLPIQVDFRRLVNWVPYSESETHYIHPYPAKLLKHIPIFFLNSSKILPRQNSLVLDPFCGSGTVLLESLLSGNNCAGCDSNPLARLISTVKTTPLDEAEVLNELDRILSSYKVVRKRKGPEVVNVDHWYFPRIKRELVRLKSAIDILGLEDKIRSFFELCFSVVARDLSTSDPGFNVPVKINPNRFKDEKYQKLAFERLSRIEECSVVDHFSNKVIENIARVKKLNGKIDGHNLEYLGEDARFIGLPNDSVDLVITSPPYAGAQKYVRASSLSLGWLGYCEDRNLRDYEKKSIGREHYHKEEYQELAVSGVNEADGLLRSIWKENPLRAHINSNYISEMRLAIREIFRVLKRGSYFLLVIANNRVCGSDFYTQDYVSEVAEQEGFKVVVRLVDDIRSRGLMTKRNKTAGLINSEWVVVLEKP